MQEPALTKRVPDRCATLRVRVLGGLSPDDARELLIQLLGERYQAGRKYGKPALNKALETIAQDSTNGPPGPLLVCIDQQGIALLQTSRYDVFG